MDDALQRPMRARSERPRRGGWLAVVLCCAIVGWLSPAHATLVLQLSEEAMVKRSSLIVRARVISQKSQWDAKKRYIFTRVKVEVLEELLGRKASRYIWIGHFGGIVGKVKMGRHRPRFKQGAEIVAFLHQPKQLKGEYLLTGWTQGLWEVLRVPMTMPDGKRPAPEVRRAGVGLSLYQPRRKRVVKARPRREPLAQLQGRLRKLWLTIKKTKPRK